MFDDWREYYFLIGSSAGGLIGLMFVVTTLTIGRDIRTIERGQKLYMSPVVSHFAAILLLSGAAIVPNLAVTAFAVLIGLIAIIGIGAGIRITVGILNASDRLTAGWFDIWWYGVAPTVLYLLLAGVSVALGFGAADAQMALAAVLMALLLTSIHNAWDLVTWLAPRSARSGPVEDDGDR